MITMTEELVVTELSEVLKEEKLKHSKRIHQKHNHVDRQIKIAKAYHIEGADKEPHRLHKKSVVTCGNSHCVMCMNPRKAFKEKTMQEKSFEQTRKWVDE